MKQMEVLINIRYEGLNQMRGHCMDKSFIFIYNFFYYFFLPPPLTCPLRIFFFVSGDFVQTKIKLGHFLTVHPRFFTALFLLLKVLFLSNLSTAYFIIKIGP